MARKRRREEALQQQAAEPESQAPSPSQGIPLKVKLPSGEWQTWVRRGWAYFREMLWAVLNRPEVLRNVAMVFGVFVVIYILSYTLVGRIYPRVEALGTNIGGMRMRGAEAALAEAWLSTAEIQVVVEGSVVDTVRPAELGMSLDAEATAEVAKQVGLGPGLFGTRVKPIITMSESGYLTAQNYILALAEQVNEAPYNAGFQFQGDQLVAKAGEMGRLVDIAPTMAALSEDPAAIVQLEQLEVFVSPVMPTVNEPDATMLTAARTVTSLPFVIRGYDPYADTTTTWSFDRETVAGWLEATPDGGVGLRTIAFAPFVRAQTNSLNGDGIQRYIDEAEAMEVVDEALAGLQNDVTVRVRYRPTEYFVEAGDTGHRISRKTGIPFFLIDQQNPGQDWSALGVGQSITLPSRDVTMPHAPLSNKRIIVDLNEQHLRAYENGVEVFHWTISSGRASAPTAPGIYQILDHAEKAYGSSFTMCGDLGCGQWEMNWFMGIYEVTPGLVNGFHGSVLLPNGALLNNGSVGNPATFGCVMSDNEQARLLYEWAEQGTVVEIISDDFPPLSALAQQA